MSTNLLKNTELLGVFCKQGAFVQTSTDHFQVFIGPFKGYRSLEQAQEQTRPQNEPILYNSNFWGFLEPTVQKNEYFTSAESFSCGREELIQFLKNAEQMGFEGAIDWQLPDQAEFKQQYDWIQDQIAQGDLLKALPIAVQRGQGSVPARLPQILLKMIESETANYSYGLWTAQSGIVGYTPEILSSWSKNKSELKTMALAGTWRKKINSGPECNHENPNFSDPKIKEEHELVIRDIENQLKTYRPLYKSETTVVELPYLYHLKTNFVYECHSIEKYLESIRLLHPTAALGLFPRTPLTAREFSQVSLQKQRQHFGAPLGYVSEAEGFMLVAIRNIMWDGPQVQLFAGCGVTGDSVFADEWSEILAKQESVKKMLGVER